MIDKQWLADWAARLESATTRALRDVLTTYPFEPDDHRIGPPSDAADLAALHDHAPWVPDDLLALYQHVGPVSLPDISNGYFIHSPNVAIANLQPNAVRPDRIDGPFACGTDIVVFGSNGRGDLYAVATTPGGPVYRLQDAGYEAGIYHGSQHGTRIIGNDLHHFLERFLTAVETFADRGRVTDV